MNIYWMGRIWRRFTISLVLFFGIMIVTLSPIEQALASSKIQLDNTDKRVIEYLCLKVPSEKRQVWLSAEKASWEPWLNNQSGFLGRQLFWNKEKEEAMLLITWASRENWKNIPQEQIDLIQQRFEELARIGTGQKDGNPFPISYAGELAPQ